MGKNVVLLSDGTGNSSATLFKTNVWRLYQALDLSAGDQVACYDDGVGTAAFRPMAILGGALGWGLKRNVKQLYAFLSRTYAAGDKVHAFGFSRGAYTIRVLVGLVHHQGLAKGETEAELWRDVKRRWWRYRKALRTRITGRARNLLAGQPARRRHDDPASAEVRFAFLGLWDTVDAYGLPVDELTRAWDTYFWPLSMPDRRLSSSVDRACHVISLDDERNTFHPVLWDEEHAPAVDHIDRERMSQVWFAGVHSNVGGGYPDDALAHVSLDWIMGEAEKRGLRFKPGARADVRVQADPRGPIDDSRSGLGGYYRYNPRKIDVLTHDTFNQVTIRRPKIHESVFQRVKDGTDAYAPIVLPERYAVVTSGGDILDGQRNPFEHPTQSRSRAHEQEQVWNWVWARRVVYFAAVASSGYLALFPLIHAPALEGACRGRWCFLSPLIGAMGSVTPGFAAPWIAAFRSSPGWFALGAALVAGCLVAGGWLSREIRDGMRLIWRPIVAAGPAAVTPHPAPDDVLYRLRSHPLYQGFFKLLTRHALPAVFALSVVYGAAAVASRVVFAAQDSMGLVCPRTAGAKRVDAAAAKAGFVTSDPCWASGLELQAGAKYRIQVKPSGDWRDGGITTTVEGFAREKMTPLMYLGLPFRRWLSEPWFKPIARLGPTGSDECPLGPVAEITARTTGELFLYVNDSVVLFPFWTYYGNNTGGAEIVVERVKAP